MSIELAAAGAYRAMQQAGGAAASAPKTIDLGADASLRPTDASGAVGGAKGQFASQLARAIDSVDAAQQKSDVLTQAFVAGENVPIHRVMIALTEAEHTIRVAATVTQRVVAAYQEIQNIQV